MEGGHIAPHVRFQKSPRQVGLNKKSIFWLYLWDQRVLESWLNVDAPRDAVEIVSATYLAPVHRTLQVKGYV